MGFSGVQDILPYIEKPSRYLGTEINCIKKDPGAVRMRVALAFPDLYEIGTSHFGIQILYHLLNGYPDIAAERVFAPGRDMEQLLRQHQLPLTTLESQTPLAGCDLIGFSLLYELNYTNVLNMLDLSGLALRSADRKNEDPVVIAGGPCVCNPEPMAPFFDAMVFGDAEALLLKMADIWLSWKADGSPAKSDLLRQWAGLSGVYVPSLFKVTYDENGFQHLHPLEGHHKRIKRAVIGDLDKAFFPHRPIVPYGRPIHDRLRLEISRGCTRGCRFCQAGMIYRPVRERSPQRLMDISHHSLEATGYEDLSLLSLSTGDYTCLQALLSNLMRSCKEARVALSLPSIRAGTLDSGLMQEIKKVRKTGFTIAPEAGSQRLRDAINKNITFEDVAQTVRDAFTHGWQVIKLYFMIGLPGETEEDLAAIAAMVKALKKIRGPRQRRGQINISLTPFVPKPHTPFQWARQISIEEANRKLAVLKDRLKLPGIHVKWQHPAMSLLEGALARGDRRMSAVLEAAFRYGCVFDGWTDQFNFDGWRKAFNANPIDIDFFTTRTRQVDEPLPWSHMRTGVRDGFLKEQWKAAFTGTLLSDCRHGECHGCGTCDFDRIQPQVFKECPSTENKPPAKPEDKESVFAQWELTYSKLDQARFFGHLEMINLFVRALRRARIKVKYSQGFHPMPRLTFDDPLPLGVESQAEHMRLWLQPGISEIEVIEAINRSLPKGLRVHRGRICRKTKKVRNDVKERYRIRLPQEQCIDDERLCRFEESSQWRYERRKRGQDVQRIDLKQWVMRIERMDPQTLLISLRRSRSVTVRPAEALAAIFNWTPHMLRGMRVCKLTPADNKLLR